MKFNQTQIEITSTLKSDSTFGQSKTISTEPTSQYLSTFQRKLLEKRLKKGDLSTLWCKRIQIMLLADQGKSQTEICQLLGCCHATARHWILIAQSGQAHTCCDNTLGRPKIVHDEYLNRLKELVEHSPRDHGYVFRRWTAGWLSKHLEKEYNIRVSDRHINRLLKQMGLSTRPQSLSKTDCTTSKDISAAQASELKARAKKIAIHDLQPASNLESGLYQLSYVAQS
ncbi:helix-turn-helix domain-containing protein [Leptolyngbyaceae cyanobacterium CCMR0082]|uniref:Helix-turn-helix domain-containing protein n=2 Tax=Adonisia turfae TaxID=2950184 RepID=A0A6M0SG56_9CYAN|nr:helix-turn-helix domain-containing protein [Adonisia turfae]MDV3348627.1 helix-turn-helix domain-containing protein [Leptothoe sp. LEGE 181152]NEZ57604.1 helix-turn-helix domain-containing protein [Adonisia turfae CCMR0081]NEZ67296.1 helix-turn-helix domain-containing protein [Adonisia turfae CCMR0082]